jgi:Holliday junction resolvasome RuvABC endonuclease subunit
MDYTSYEGQEFQGAKILKYLGKTPGGQPQFKVRMPSGNIYERTLTTIKKGVVDTKSKKVETKKKYVQKTKEKGNATFNNDILDIYGFIGKSDNILVLDQATLNTGYCIIKQNQIQEYGRICQKDKNHYVRIKELVQDIGRLVKTNDIKSIIIEDIYLGYSPTTYRALSETIGAIALYAILNNISIIAIPYSIWSNRIGLRGKRTELKSQSLKLAHEIIGREISSNDASDAILIAYSYLLSKGSVKEDLVWE